MGSHYPRNSWLFHMEDRRGSGPHSLSPPGSFRSGSQCSGAESASLSRFSRFCFLLPWGKFFVCRAACGLAHCDANFLIPGGGCKESPQARACPAHAPKRPAASRGLPGSKPSVFPPLPGHLPGGLLVVMMLAQALMVSGVDEQPPVPPMGLHMVHHRGPGSDTTPGTLAAERLPQQLRRAQIIRPDGQAVPAVVLRRPAAGRLFWLVDRTPALPGEGRTSGVPAGPERL